jgi:hypothetical protein
MSKAPKNETEKDKNTLKFTDKNIKIHSNKNNKSFTDMESIKSDSSENYSNEFNQNFFENDIDNNINTNFTTNTEAYSNDIIKDNENIEKKEFIKKGSKENDYISKNSIYESNTIVNNMEENNSSYKFSFNLLKYLNLNIFSGLNNNNGNNNTENNQNNLEIDNSSLLNSITSFINDKFMKPDLRWIINSNSIKILKTIGFGGSSDVYLGDYRGTEVAVKKLRLIEAKKDYIKEYKREVSSLVLLYHPYLVLLMGAIAEPFNLSIVTEFCKGGNLFELLYKKPNVNLTWELKKKILLQIAIGMNYLHTNNPPVLHRDLKSLNILLTNNIEKDSDTTDIKISDFGLSRLYQKSCIMSGNLGTCYWMAPEIIVNKKYTTKVDVYSYGIIIWEMCTRKIPYSCMSQQHIQFYVSVKKGRPNLKIIPNNTPPKIVQLMQMCWEHEPDNRPTFDYIVDFLRNLSV